MNLITKEVEESQDDAETLFRANSSATKAFKFYSKMVRIFFCLFFFFFWNILIWMDKKKNSSCFSTPQKQIDWFALSFQNNCRPLARNAQRSWRCVVCVENSEFFRGDLSLASFFFFFALININFFSQFLLLFQNKKQRRKTTMKAVLSYSRYFPHLEFSYIYISIHT